MNLEERALEGAKLLCSSFNVYEGKEELLKKLILKHMGHGTYIEARNNGELVACVRFNLSPTGNVAHVVDLAIKPGEWGRFVMQMFVCTGVLRHPSIRYIRFERDYKYPKRGVRLYKVSKFLKFKGVHNG